MVQGLPAWDPSFKKQTKSKGLGHSSIFMNQSNKDLSNKLKMIKDIKRGSDP
jgi:hypothetical protein